MPSTSENASENSPESGHTEDVTPSRGDGTTLRQGTISSARFNILCTMVGGGCLSLPMAFQKTGNGLFGPLLLVITAIITEFCFRIIVASIRRLSPVRESTTVIGKDSFETMASAAFGAQGFLFAKWLVTAVSYRTVVECRFYWRCVRFSQLTHCCFGCTILRCASLVPLDTLCCLEICCSRLQTPSLTILIIIMRPWDLGRSTNGGLRQKKEEAPVWPRI